MGYKAAVQILRQAEDLKLKVLKKCDLLTDSEVWTHQQRLQDIYHQALVLDLEYALDKKVEQDLWNIGFRNHITALQEKIRDKKNSRLSEYQTLLTWCLESASGFYLTLLQELCDIFDLDLPFRRRGNIYGLTYTGRRSGSLPQSLSCIYICQYCLVHLGDIARYRNQRKQAENFYKQAIMVSPISGHPYNQLALLEASQGDKLSTVFYYIRGIAVKNPFPAATTNLISIFSSIIEKECPLGKKQAKITANEFIQIFLCTHGLLHSATDLNQAKIGIDTLNASMTALVATQSFNADILIKLIVINLYTLSLVSGNELTEEEKIIKEIVLDLLVGSLSALLVPVHTLKSDESMLDYCALPAIKLLIYWIKGDPSILLSNIFVNRMQIWPSLCKLLNNSRGFLDNFNYTKYNSIPLYEDKMLEGFKPLMNVFQEIDFKSDELDDNKIEKLIRIKRLKDFAIFLTDYQVNNSKLILRNEDSGKIIFDPGIIQPDPTNDLLEEIKSINLFELSKKSEKRCGILKPQGSLEKSREERELLISDQIILSDLSNNNSLSINNNDKKEQPIKIKRSKQNAALQSIFKKIEENKQVKFNVEDKISDNCSEQKVLSKSPSSIISLSSLSSLSSSSSLSSIHHPLSQKNQQKTNQNFVSSFSNQSLNYPNTLKNIHKPLLKQENNYQYSPNNDLLLPTPAPLPLLSTRAPPPQQQQGGLNLYPNSQIFNSGNHNPINYGSSGSNFNPRLAPSQANLTFNSTLQPSPALAAPPAPPPPQQQQQQQQQQYPSQNFIKPNDESSLLSPPQAHQPTLPPTSNSWWPQNYQRSEAYPSFNYNFTNLTQSYMLQPNNFSNQLTNQSGGDVYNNSPWSCGRVNFNENLENCVNNNTQLKQTTNIDKLSPTISNGSSSSSSNVAGGYSLFNTNNWQSNLVGTLKNSKITDNPNYIGQQLQQQQQQQQQSFFTGQGPQSLAQLLLEQQQIQQKDL